MASNLPYSSTQSKSVPPDPPRDINQDRIVGIDLGTTNSLVAFCDDRGPRALAGPGGPTDLLMPSVVRYSAEDASVEAVGTDAEANAIEHPLRTISSSKRFMGRGMSDVAEDAPYMSYAIAAGPNDTARIRLPFGDSAKLIAPQEVAAAILRTLRDRASASLGVDVRRAVVTVPAYFDDAQRQATRDAGRIAGLDIVRIINEPTAAALAYGIGLGDSSGARTSASRTVAVYDLGGGTLDVSILRLVGSDGEGDSTDFFQVLSTAGDTRLGGDDIDRAIIDELLEGTGISAASGDLPPAARRGLRTFARNIKHRLSDESSVAARVDLGDGRVVDTTMTRERLEILAGPLIERSIAACRTALRDASPASGRDALEIDAVVLVGGSTRMPLVRSRVAAFFGLEPYTALDPDTVVALGASVQGDILSGRRSGALLLDVVPLSLGIETRGGAVAKLIMRNSSTPARATEMFSTSVDGQVSIKLNVVQGEREMAEDCRSLGEFHLAGLPPMPAGVPQLDVEFLVDANGVLRVSASERRSGKRAQLQVVPNHGLTAEEVDQMEADSLTHARDDMTRHRIVDLITNARLDMKWIGDRLDRHRDALEADYAAELDAKLSSLREICDRAESDWRAVEPNAFHAEKESLDRASMRLQEVGIAASLRADEKFSD